MRWPSRVFAVDVTPRPRSTPPPGRRSPRTPRPTPLPSRFPARCNVPCTASSVRSMAGGYPTGWYPLRNAESHPRGTRIHIDRTGKWGKVLQSGTKWGTVAPANDRSGGAPPTPPLRSRTLPRGSIGVPGPLRTLAGREEPAEHSGQVPRSVRRGLVLAKDSSPASRSGRRRRTRRRSSATWPAATRWAAQVPQAAARFFSGNSFDIELDAAGRVTLRRRSSSTRGSRRRSSWPAWATTSRSGTGSAGAPSRSAWTPSIGEMTESLGNPS